ESTRDRRPVALDEARPRAHVEAQRLALPEEEARAEVDLHGDLVALDAAAGDADPQLRLEQERGDGGDAVLAAERHRQLVVLLERDVGVTAAHPVAEVRAETQLAQRQARDEARRRRPVAEAREAVLAARRRGDDEAGGQREGAVAGVEGDLR